MAADGPSVTRLRTISRPTRGAFRGAPSAPRSGLGDLGRSLQKLSQITGRFVETVQERRLQEAENEAAELEAQFQTLPEFREAVEEGRVEPIDNPLVRRSFLESIGGNAAVQARTAVEQRPDFSSLSRDEVNEAFQKELDSLLRDAPAPFIRGAGDAASGSFQALINSHGQAVRAANRQQHEAGVQADLNQAVEEAVAFAESPSGSSTNAPTHVRDLLQERIDKHTALGSSSILVAKSAANALFGYARRTGSREVLAAGEEITVEVDGKEVQLFDLADFAEQADRVEEQLDQEYAANIRRQRLVREERSRNLFQQASQHLLAGEDVPAGLEERIIELHPRMGRSYLNKLQKDFAQEEEPQEDDPKVFQQTLLDIEYGTLSSVDLINREGLTNSTKMSLLDRMREQRDREPVTNAPVFRQQLKSLVKRLGVKTDAEEFYTQALRAISQSADEGGSAVEKMTEILSVSDTEKELALARLRADVINDFTQDFRFEAARRGPSFLQDDSGAIAADWLNRQAQLAEQQFDKLRQLQEQDQEETLFELVTRDEISRQTVVSNIETLGADPGPRGLSRLSIPVQREVNRRLLRNPSLSHADVLTEIALELMESETIEEVTR